LLRLEGVGDSDLLGQSLGYAGDVNGDGGPDIVVGAPGFDAPGKLNGGAAYVFSLRALELATDTSSISLVAGGSQDLSLQAPLTVQGDFYLLLGSASGQKPGISLDGFPLLLNPDLYTTSAASLANLPPFVQFADFLDANAQASARFELPAGMDPSLAGVTLDHAFVAIDWLPFPVVTFVSNAVPVTLVP
jgi:hypothetical protein